MTQDQFEQGTALRKRIDRLKQILNVFMVDSVNMDDSLTRLTSFYIRKHDQNLICVDQGELLFLIKAYESEIDRLESEFRRL